MEAISDAAVFCAVVEKGSFTSAADALGLSKAAVSKFVARLETRLNARLLNRTTRRISATEIGEAFYHRASRALEELDEAQREVSDRADKPYGHLRISAPTFYGAEILSKLLDGFHQAYPDISIDLQLDNRFVDLVEERFDVALRISAPKDSSLIMRKLADIPMIVCASPRYIAQRGKPTSPDELGNHECIIYTLAPRSREWHFLHKDGSLFTVHINGKLQINDDHVGRQAAVDGLGILQMPKLFLEDELAKGKLVQIFPDEAMRTATLALVYPSRKSVPAKVKAFVDFLVQSTTQHQSA